RASRRLTGAESPIPIKPAPCWPPWKHKSRPGPPLVAFFGARSDRGLRSGEAVMFRMADLRLRADKGEWGDIQLTAAAPVTEKQQVSGRFAQAGVGIG
ncbi:MAG: hypothetical protein ACLPQY_15660, partial [Streptosporangiaceae bacterium]